MPDTPLMRELSVAEQRYQAVLAVISDGETVADVAARFGVRRQSVHEWLARFEAGGLENLADRSHRPARPDTAAQPHSTPSSRECPASTEVAVTHQPKHCPASTEGEMSPSNGVTCKPRRAGQGSNPRPKDHESALECTSVGRGRK